MSDCEIDLTFKDSTEPVTLRDKDLIKRIPLIVRSIENQTADWETEDVKLTVPLMIPFQKFAGEFLFKNLRAFQPPVEKATTLADYESAKERSLEELKEVIELANFLECVDFMKSIGYVIGTRLNDMSVEDIAIFFGVDVNRERDLIPEDEKWMHAPNGFSQNQNE